MREIIKILISNWSVQFERYYTIMRWKLFYKGISLNFLSPQGIANLSQGNA